MSDREEDDIYDFATKYQGTSREQLQQQQRFAHSRLFQTASPRSSKATSPPSTSSLAEQRPSSKLSPSG